ncbi:MAG: PKD-like family lipoprotein [Marinifilaceae bacterium]
MKNIYYILLLAICWSCSKDLGNYNYNLIPAVNIKSIADDQVRVMIGETVTLKPEIELPEGKTDDHYEYRWMVKSLNAGITFTDTVGYTRDVQFEATYGAGRYSIELNITDKEHDIMYSKYTYLHISGSMTGWVFMEKHGDYAEVSMYAINSEDEKIYIPGILAKSGVDKELCRNPRKITEIWESGLVSDFGLWVLTDNCTFYLDYRTGLKFQPKQKLSTILSAMVSENYTVENLSRISLNQDIAIFPGDGSFAYTRGSGLPFFGDFNTSCFLGQVNLYPHAITHEIMSNSYAVFDKNSSYFLNFDTGSNMYMPVGSQIRGEIIHMQTLANDMAVALFKDGNFTFEYIVPTFPFMVTNPNAWNGISKLNDKALIAYHQNLAIPYYSIGDNKLYTISNRSETECVFLKGKFEGNITAIQTLYFRHRDYVGMRNYIAIATEMPDGTGRVYIVEPQTQGSAQRLTIIDEVNTEAPVISIQYHEKI